MKAKSINDLDDEHFAHIESGGRKDVHGRTMPRTLRHLPVHDAAHVRAALARLNQTDIPPDAKKAALSKILAAARKFGVKVDEDMKRHMGDKMDMSALSDEQVLDLIEELSRCAETQTASAGYARSGVDPNACGDQGSGRTDSTPDETMDRRSRNFDVRSHEFARKVADETMPTPEDTPLTTPNMDALVAKFSKEESCKDLLTSVQTLAGGGDIAAEVFTAFDQLMGEKVAASAQILSLSKTVGDLQKQSSDTLQKLTAQSALVEQLQADRVELQKQRHKASVDAILADLKNAKLWPTVFAVIEQYAYEGFMTETHDVVSLTKDSKTPKASPLDVILEAIKAIPADVRTEQFTQPQTQHGGPNSGDPLDEQRVRVRAFVDGNRAQGINENVIKERTQVYLSKNNIALPPAEVAQILVTQ